MSKVIPRDRVKKLLTDSLANASEMDAAAIEAEFTKALAAARLQNKPTYRPEEVAALGQALMASALERVESSLAQVKKLQDAE